MVDFPFLTPCLILSAEKYSAAFRMNVPINSFYHIGMCFAFHCQVTFSFIYLITVKEVQL